MESLQIKSLGKSFSCPTDSGSPFVRTPLRFRINPSAGRFLHHDDIHDIPQCISGVDLGKTSLFTSYSKNHSSSLVLQCYGVPRQSECGNWGDEFSLAGCLPIRVMSIDLSS